MASRNSSSPATAPDDLRRDIITIPAEDIPSKAYSLSFQEPRYKDYYKARKLYPFNQQQSAAYSVEQLLFALQLRAVNSTPVPETSSDVSELLKTFQITDVQFLVTLFAEAYFIDNDIARAAREHADRLAQTGSLTYVIDKNSFPAKSHTVTLRTPVEGTRAEIDRRYQGPQISGCTLEEALTAFCIATVDGEEPIRNKNNMVVVFEDWPIVDVQYLVMLFVGLFTIDEAESNRAKDLGKRLRQRYGANASATVRETTEVPA